MTDKEQIIITGVDVSECEFFDGSHLCKCDKTIIDEHKKLKNIFSVKYVNCRDNYNCYFKQLARKTEECEELKAYTQRQENQRETYYKEFLKLSQECDRYRKALDEIEGIVSKDYYDDNWADISTKLDEIFNIINKAKGD